MPFCHCWPGVECSCMMPFDASHVLNAVEVYSEPLSDRKILTLLPVWVSDQAQITAQLAIWVAQSVLATNLMIL